MPEPVPASEPASPAPKKLDPRKVEDILRRHNLAELVRHAEDAALVAGRLIQDYRGKFRVTEKGKADLLTDADPAAQAAVIGHLSARCPGSTFLGEEDGVRPDPAAPLKWIIDPIDGTTNYVHGFPFYAVSIGLEVEGHLAAGVIYDPSRDEMFSASAGAGATRNGRAIRVSGVPRLAVAMLATGFPPALGTEGTARDLSDRYSRFARASHSVVRMGCATLSLAYVAAGMLDGVYAYTWKPWDSAAGAVLVREAGGRVANLGGSPDTYDVMRPDIIATNGLIHAEVDAMAAG